MKGVVFTEFLEMVETQFGLEVTDRIIEQSNLPNDGAYTSVGTYEHEELLKLVGNLSREADAPPQALVKAFGQYLFKRFSQSFPEFFAGVDSAFAFLSRVDDVIHVEVRKLYPDAELPRFRLSFPDIGQMELRYESSRPFADLAEGLIEACSRHFGEEIVVSREDDPTAPGCRATFLLRCEQGAELCTTSL